MRLLENGLRAAFAKLCSLQLAIIVYRRFFRSIWRFHRLHSSQFRFSDRFRRVRFHNVSHHCCYWPGLYTS